jgi:hypothetical protein
MLSSKLTCAEVGELSVADASTGAVADSDWLDSDADFGAVDGF